jgi:hypothetical protein
LCAEHLLRGSETLIGCLDGFRDEEECAVVFTHPFASKARFQVFESLGLTTPDSAPHSVLVQRSTEFIIFLPPKPAAP